MGSIVDPVCYQCLPVEWIRGLSWGRDDEAPLIDNGGLGREKAAAFDDA